MTTFCVVVIMGTGGVPKLMKMLEKVTGGFGKTVVNSGNQLVAGGVVALPVLNCGCVNPATDGGTGAGLTLALTVNDGSGENPGGGNAGVPDPKAGGGNFGEPVVTIGGAGTVALPLPNTGCSIPATEGGTVAAPTIGSDMAPPS